MIDPVDLMLGERLAHDRVEGPRALEAVPERLFDDDPHPRLVRRIRHAARHAARGQVADHLGIHARRDGEVEQAPSHAGAGERGVHGVEPPTQRVIRLRVIQVPPHVEQPLAEARGQGGAAAVGRELLEPALHRRAERRVVERLARHADHGEVGREETVVHEVIQRGEQLASREVSPCAEDDERTWLRSLHGRGRRVQRLGDARGDGQPRAHVDFTA